MNNTTLKEFAPTCVVMEVARKLSPEAIDATMLISIAMRQAITHYYAYQAELAGITITEEDVLARLSEAQAAEVRLSKNKRELIMAAVRKELADFKTNTAKIIAYLEQNQQQVDSASPQAQLKLKNLLREQQGLKPLKRLPKDLTLAPTPTKQAA